MQPHQRHAVIVVVGTAHLDAVQQHLLLTLHLDVARPAHKAVQVARALGAQVAANAKGLRARLEQRVALVRHLLGLVIHGTGLAGRLADAGRRRGGLLGSTSLLSRLQKHSQQKPRNQQQRHWESTRSTRTDPAQSTWHPTHVVRGVTHATRVRPRDKKKNVSSRPSSAPSRRVSSSHAMAGANSATGMQRRRPREKRNAALRDSWLVTSDARRSKQRLQQPCTLRNHGTMLPATPAHAVALQRAAANETRAWPKNGPSVAASRARPPCRAWPARL